MYKIGDKVKIQEGVGYTDITDGINRFRRAQEDVKGIIYDIGTHRRIYVMLESGRKVETDESHVVRDLA